MKNREYGMSNLTENEMKAWNDYLEVVNKKVIELDNDKDAQMEYLSEVKYDMMMNEDFYYANIESWYVSQRQICGCPVCDFELLYPSFMGSKCKWA